MAKFLSLLKETNGKVRMDPESNIMAYGESVS